MKPLKLYYIGFLLIICYGSLDVCQPADSYAQNITESEALILDSAENFFTSIRDGNFKTAWELLSDKSHKTIINDVYKTSVDMGVIINKDDVIEDFNSNGVMFNNYWRAVLKNFNPDIVLEDRIWELGAIKSDRAIILLKNRAVTELKMFKENSQWKVGFVETFWVSNAVKIIDYLKSLFFQ